MSNSSNTSERSSNRTSSKIVSQDSSNTISGSARPDLLENAIVLADYAPTREQKNDLPRTTLERVVSDQSVEEGLEASNITVQGGTPKRQNPFRKPNL